MATWADEGFIVASGKTALPVASLLLQGMVVNSGRASVNTATLTLNGMVVNSGRASLLPDVIIGLAMVIGSGRVSIPGASFVGVFRPSYSNDDILDLLFPGISSTPGFAGSNEDFSREREMAYDWVNDQLRDRYFVPFTNASQLVVMAEALYTVGLILRSKTTMPGFEFSVYNPFFQEAELNISKLRSVRIGPDGSPNKNQFLSTTTAVKPTLSKSQVNSWGQRHSTSSVSKRLDFF